MSCGDFHLSGVVPCSTCLLVPLKHQMQLHSKMISPSRCETDGTLGDGKDSNLKGNHVAAVTGRYFTTPDSPSSPAPSSSEDSLSGPPQRASADSIPRFSVSERLFE
ncbi:unnamed protein product [Cyclocybe aegerita]|uniref:Uncharacterized protein n=1 Tax=Cyclocybe aegerita TaxID=1973307 RepID=A0A8S0W6U1_CYCAE|nr:unnamed protein product [Cyclocybe aegerita]